MAELIESSMNEVDGVEARSFSIEDFDKQFVAESRAVLFGTPIYTANMCWQMKKFLDEPIGVSMDGKLGGVFATAAFAQGAPGVGLSSLIDHLLCHGMLVYSVGCSQRPMTHLGPVAIAPLFEESREMFVNYGHNFAKKALELFG